jgi:hypothetical protein
MTDFARVETYLRSGSRAVDGYLQSGGAAIVWSLLDIQDELAVGGDIAEIGVYHGKLFTLMCLALREGERAYAIDVFDSEAAVQGIVTSQDRERFGVHHLRAALAANAIDQRAIDIVTANSRTFSPTSFRARLKVASVRLFSVDGDHSREGVRHDLHLAETVLGTGGVVIVDDLFNTLCPSLTEGVIDFFHEGGHDLEPVAIAASNGPAVTGAAKLFVARAEYAMRYRAYLRLLHRSDFKLAAPFLGHENVPIFDFQAVPTKHPLDDSVRGAVARFFAAS